ncbi:hypothetical protein E3U43_018912 [Larimichthys crocea]|uniref:Uncharacterized protein n=1 Tax=Larimichthys crocea TaxID=215358 RepID=A0ACD3QXU3_LARCR|nr:hypothetical protein E3U43_018912 [Larimichthys crocea]
MCVCGHSQGRCADWSVCLFNTDSSRLGTSCQSKDVFENCNMLKTEAKQFKDFETSLTFPATFATSRQPECDSRRKPRQKKIQTRFTDTNLNVQCKSISSTAF